MASRREFAARPLMARKFGRKFKPLDLQPIASLNYRELGKVKVDVQFRQSKSLWGVLGDDKNPAGILYLDLKFDQPKSCRLSSATVVVTLEDVDDPSVTHDDDGVVVEHNSATNLVQVVDRYGPKQLSGEQRIMPVKKTYNFTPRLDVLGNGGGGLGIDTEKTRIFSSRWTFRGDLMPGIILAKDKRHKGVRGTVYKSIKWELSENDIETQTAHSNVIHTGFAFQHDGKTCFLRVEIDGKLLNTKDRIKRKLHFPPVHRKSEGSALTVMDLTRSKEYKACLDQIADGLSRAMELENYTAIPVEVPDALPASYQGVPLASGQNEPAFTSTLNGASPTTQNTFVNSSSVPQGRINATSEQQYLDDVIHASDPMIELLARALDPTSSTHSVSGSVQSVETLVEERSLGEEQVVSSSEVQKDLMQIDVEREAFLKLSQSPVLLLLVQFLARFLDLFAAKAPESHKQIFSNEHATPHTGATQKL